MKVLLNKKEILCLENGEHVQNIKLRLCKILNCSQEDFYLTCNGKLFNSESPKLDHDTVYLVPRTLGGKGGFGSMLRAIGAQIEKTTNREACRDLSGRRLRDINEEQRLKDWVATQSDRERETEERRKKKLERLCQKPKHEFKDEAYDKEREELPEKIEEAVLKGLEASCSTSKRKSKPSKVVPKKKPKLWVDSEFDDLSSGSSSDEEDAPKKDVESIAQKTIQEKNISSTDTEEKISDTK